MNDDLGKRGRHPPPCMKNAAVCPMIGKQDGVYVFEMLLVDPVSAPHDQLHAD
jgi:hypothetical protein